MIAWKPAPMPSKFDAAEKCHMIRELAERRGTTGVLSHHPTANAARNAKRRAIMRAKQMFPGMRFEFTVIERALYGRCL